jgi:hypothetical protein
MFFFGNLCKRETGVRSTYMQCSSNQQNGDKQSSNFIYFLFSLYYSLFLVLLHFFIYVTVVCNDTILPILYYIVNLDFNGGTNFGLGFYVTARDDECLDRLDELYGGDTGIYSEDLFFSLNGYYSSKLYQSLAAKHDYRVRPPPPPKIAGGTAASTTKQILLIIGMTTFFTIISLI